MDVEAWLNDLGLGQYAEAFGANDGKMLPSLDGDDLKERGVAWRGVASLGHRKKLLTAIERLRGGGVDVTPEAHHELFAGERLQVTILFTDIARFSLLSTEREIIAERIHAGLARAREQGPKSGKPIGRPRTSRARRRAVVQAREAGRSIRQITGELKMSSATVQEVLREDTAKAA